MDCSQAVADIPERLAGELAADAAAALDQHLAGCARCRGELAAMEQAWAALGEDGGERAFPLTPRFAQETLPRLRDATAARTRRRRSRPVARHLWGWGLAAAAGFALARLAGHEQAPAPAPTVTLVEPAASGGAPRGQHLLVGAGDPLVAPLASFVADDVATDGGRARAIALVNQLFGGSRPPPPPEVVEALTRTLRLDSNPGVRRKAAEALARLEPTPEIRDAFILALRRDRNPAVRILAIEALARAARAFDPASIETLRERAGDQNESQHLRTRAARALSTIAL
jgi:HEAT repeat protein